jgi:hypothetical protein
MLSVLAGCEVTVGPPQSSEESQPHKIQVPAAQAAVMGKGIELQEQRERAAREDEQSTRKPDLLVAQREGRANRARGEEKAADGPPPGFNERRAIDRIGAEIRDALSLRKTLVVWLIENTADSKKLADDATDLITKQMQEFSGQPNPLEMAAVSYGSDPTILTPVPVGSADELRRSLAAAKSGQGDKANVFAALKRAADEYVPYRKRGYEVIFVLVGTSDADDPKAADEPIATLKRAAVQVFGLGPTVPFGVAGRGRRPAVSESSKRQLESYSPERIQLALSGSQNTADLTDSGYGSFALERICRQTGGKFLRLHNGRPPGWKLDPGTGDIPSELSAKYAPDYVSEDDYGRLLAENKCRIALHNAALLPPSEGLPAVVKVDFPKPKDEAALAKNITEAQKPAAEHDLAIQKLYDALIAGEPDRSKLTGARWQAGYDLAMGQVLAAKARLDGYNAVLAVLKQGKNFANPNSTRWALEPADEIAASSALDKMAKSSRTYLNRVINEHPGTPWAEIAQRELRYPAGWKLVER